MAKDIIYVRHLPAEKHAFRMPTGMVGRWTGQQAAKGAVIARAEAPKPGQGKGYATGELASKIRSTAPKVGRKGPEADIVSATDHSTVVHEGTPPHIIKPRAAEQLVFFWRKAGRVVFKDSVRHPGTKANPFLLRALRKLFGGPGR